MINADYRPPLPGPTWDFLPDHEVIIENDCHFSGFWRTAQSSIGMTVADAKLKWRHLEWWARDGYIKPAEHTPTWHGEWEDAE